MVWTGTVFFFTGMDCSVGTATRYRLDGLGIESWCVGEIFRTCPETRWSPRSLLYNGYCVIPVDKAAAAWR